MLVLLELELLLDELLLVPPELWLLPLLCELWLLVLLDELLDELDELLLEL